MQGIAETLDAINQAVIVTRLDGSILYWTLESERKRPRPHRTGVPPVRTPPDDRPVGCGREGRTPFAQSRRGEAQSPVDSVPVLSPQFCNRNRQAFSGILAGHTG